MAHKIQIKRGSKADLPTLNDGEMGLCLDTNEVYVGNNGTNVPVGGTATTADITYYVSTTGNDSNDGLTSGTPFKTIQYAVNKLPKNIKHYAHINVADGVYDETVTIEGFYGEGTLYINGWDKTTTKIRSLKIYKSSLYINLAYMQVNPSAYATVDYSIEIWASYSVRLNDMSCVSANVSAGKYKAHLGLFNNSFANVSFCTFSNADKGVHLGTGSKLLISDSDGTGNGVGVDVDAGSMAINNWGGVPTGTVPLQTFNGGQFITPDLNVNKLAEQVSTHEGNLITHSEGLVTDLGGVHGIQIEEGIWTPSLTSEAGGEATYSENNYGSYVKIGNLVYVQFNLYTTSKGDMVAGNVRLGGLPFMVSGNVAQDTPALVISRHNAMTYPVGSATLAGLAPRFGNLIQLIFLSSGSNFTYVKDTDVAAAVDIRGSMVYKTS